MRHKLYTYAEIQKLDLFDGNMFNAGAVELDSFATQTTTKWIFCDEFIGRSRFKGMNLTGRQRRFRYVGNGKYQEDKTQARNDYKPNYQNPVYPW